MTPASHPGVPMHPHDSRNNPFHIRRTLGVAGALLLALGTGACARDALLAPEGPLLDGGPAAQISVTPDTAVVGDTGVVLTIRGTGFTEMSFVWIDPWLPGTPAFVDDSTLTVRIEGPLQQPATHQVTVFNESWEMSNPAW